MITMAPREILAVLAVGLIGYAIFGMIFSGSSGKLTKKKAPFKISPQPAPGEEQRAAYLAAQVHSLDEELKALRAEYENRKIAFSSSEEKQAKLAEELTRRQEWVAKAESELSKIKLECQDFKNKFIAKETELEEGFSKNVNLERQVQQLKTELENKEKENKAKTEQEQIQKHQIENQALQIKEQASLIAEFKQKEKNSQWVPKEEFNQLNQEYSEIEKDLENKEEKLKVFSDEIIQLKNQLAKSASNVPPAELSVNSSQTAQVPQPEESIKPAEEKHPEEPVVNPDHQAQEVVVEEPKPEEPKEEPKTEN